MVIAVEFEAGSIRSAYEGGNFDIENLLSPMDTFNLFWEKSLLLKGEMVLLVLDLMIRY